MEQRHLFCEPRHPRLYAAPYLRHRRALRRRRLMLAAHAMAVVAAAGAIAVAAVL